MTTVYTPGRTYTVELEFIDQTSGVLTDPGTVQLDITYGSTLGSGTPDYAGPFSYSGASTPSSTQVYRISKGLYAYDWPIPASAAGGVYVATWSVGYGGQTLEGEENLWVEAAGLTPPNSGDIGFWTGSLTYGDITLQFGTQDTSGTAWALLGVDGMDGAPTDGQVVQRAGDHGGYPTPQFYAPRPITLRVFASATSQAERDQARALMQQVVPVSDLATLVYNEPIPKTLQVRRSGVIKETYPDLMSVEFNALLIAPDPRKYGAATSVTVIANSQTLGITPPITLPITLPAQPPPGAATVTNAGNFETRPQITVTGPITGPGLYNQTTGQLISFSTLTLAATDTLTLDLLNQVAYLDGSPIPADLTSSWWALDPGTSQIVLQGAGGAGAQMTITFNDAWM
jgi:hypothetical protein